MTIERNNPEEFPPRELVERFLSKRKTDATEHTLRSYQNRLTRFLEWCEGEGVERMGDLTPYHVDEYDVHLRQTDNAPTTIKGKLATLRVFLDYAEGIGAADESVYRAVDLPELSDSDARSEDRLEDEDAIDALTHFRNNPARFGTPQHTYLEVAWHVGCRLGGFIALDRSDYDADEQSLEFVHRPDTGTGLKNKKDGERIVALSDKVCEALDYYLAREHTGKRDEYGREPLFSTIQARPSRSTFRAWSYQASHPCIWMECPHGRRRDRCHYTERNHAGGCPSARSPHAVRTGSITWQLNQGVPIEVVAKRVNASPSTIRRYYDVASKREEFENRRKEIGSKLDIDTEGKSNE